jgi:hypothetical protein
VVSQSSGAQFTLPRSAHAPAPSQVFGFCDLFLLQVAGKHSVPATQWRQAPAPSQAPSVPQLAAGVALQRPWGSEPPAATLAQAPTKPGTLQAWQTPQDADPQQTPSVQLPLSQSVPAAHSAPSGFNLQSDPAQVAGAVQSASDVHDIVQAPPAQV